MNTNNILLEKQAARVPASVLRALYRRLAARAGSLGAKATRSKAVRGIYDWFNPKEIEHIRSIKNVPGVSGAARSGSAYGSIPFGDAVRGIDDVSQIRRKPRIGRILAALGVPVAGGSAAYILSGDDSGSPVTPSTAPAVPAISAKSESSSGLPATGHKLSPAAIAALATLVGGAGIGGAAWMLSRRKSKAQKEEEDENDGTSKKASEFLKKAYILGYRKALESASAKTETP